MGFVKQLLGGVMGSKQAPYSPSSASTTPNPEEENARRKRAAQIASSQPGQLTSAGGDMSAAPLARKTLLGL